MPGVFQFEQQLVEKDQFAAALHQQLNKETKVGVYRNNRGLTKTEQTTSCLGCFFVIMNKK